MLSKEVPLIISLHILYGCYVPLSSIPLQWSGHSLHANAGSDIHVTTFTIGKRLGFVDVGMRMLEGGYIGRRGEGNLERAVIPTIYSNSSRRISIVT
jgi:hypothetical protein